MLAGQVVNSWPMLNVSSCFWVWQLGQKAPCALVWGPHPLNPDSGDWLPVPRPLPKLTPDCRVLIQHEMGFWRILGLFSFSAQWWVLTWYHFIFKAIWFLCGCLRWEIKVSWNRVCHIFLGVHTNTLPYTQKLVKRASPLPYSPTGALNRLTNLKQRWTKNTDGPRPANRCCLHNSLQHEEL